MSSISEHKEKTQKRIQQLEWEHEYISNEIGRMECKKYQISSSIDMYKDQLRRLQEQAECDEKTKRRK